MMCTVARGVPALLAVFVLLIGFDAIPTGNTARGWGQEDLTIAIGEDRVFSAFDINYHDSWFQGTWDIGEIIPHGPGGRVESQTNYAQVFLSATAGHAAEAAAVVGLEFEWDLGGHAWEEVKGWPVQVTINMSYGIYAGAVDGNGVAESGINVVGFSDPWLDFLSYGAGDQGWDSRSTCDSGSCSVDRTYTTTVQELEAVGRRIAVLGYSQVSSGQEHSIPEGYVTHAAHAEVSINSVGIDFGIPVYLALGDSVPTGHSVASFSADGSPATDGYPKRLQIRFQDADTDLSLVEAAEWGATCQEQLDELDALLDQHDVEVATITVGANDMHYADVLRWVFWGQRSRRQQAANLAAQLRPCLNDLLRTLMENEPDAELFITNYYNPMHPQRCRFLHTVTEDMLWAGALDGLNDVIAAEAASAGAHLVDVYTDFVGHEMQSPEPWVFGTECGVGNLLWILVRQGGNALAQAADPHPNAGGAQALADTIWEVARP